MIINDLNVLLDCMHSFDMYTNCINIFVKSAKQGTKLSWNIIQSSKDIKFNLKNIIYSPQSGIVDFNLNNFFRHSFINVYLDYIVNTQKNVCKNKDIFSGYNLGFLGSTSLLFTLTTKGITQFENLNTLKYVDIENTLIASKTFTGGIGYQYASAIHTLIKNEDLFNIKDLFKYSNYMRFSNELYFELLKNVQKKTTMLIDSKYIDLDNATLEDFIRAYTYIIKENKFFIDNNFDSQILDFQKWMLKSGYYNPNLNDIIRIIKDITIDINTITNKPTINFTLMFVDSSIFNKHLIGNIEDLNEFVEVLQKNENFNTLSTDDLSELKNRFKPLL